MKDTPNATTDAASGSSSLRPAKKLPRIRLFVYFFYFCVLAFLLVFLVSNYQELNLLLHEGRVTRAEVTDKSSTSGKSESYHLKCQFEVDGRMEETWESISRETYRHTHLGDQITITYLPANPSQSRMGRVDQAVVDDARKVGILAFSFLAIAFSLLTWYIERRVRR